ncbi:MAG: DUF4383 domain-containing protein [Actinomycetota bacterium]|nr:DUF4383 domain-containing protein [Actinomycetota bacterium]
MVYLVIGVAGFLSTGFENFAADSADKLIIFEINPLHNIVHILIGAMWVAGARTAESAKQVNMIIGVAYLLVALLGIFGLLDGLINNNGADVGLHLVSGAAALYFATAGSGT